MQFKRMPFGIQSGPSHFQHVMNETLAPWLWIFIIVYINDIVVYSETFEDHLSHIDKVLHAIKLSGITLAPSKCHFGYQSLTLLGQKVSRLGMSTLREWVDMILAIKPPTNIKELQSVLGLFNYYKHYIPDSAQLAKPLYDQLWKDEPWNWTSERQVVLDEIKLRLVQAPVLAYPIAGNGYRLYTDASKDGIAGVLQQHQGNSPCLQRSTETK